VVEYFKDRRLIIAIAALVVAFSSAFVLFGRG
jgi:hypothetical protein